MPHAPSILATIALELVLAASGGLLARKLCLRPLVKYLAASSAIGPSTPGFIGDANLANQLAEIGVMVFPSPSSLRTQSKMAYLERRLAVLAR
jgi:monovalent cation:H+ antiporter-2, CPA2 family